MPKKKKREQPTTRTRSQLRFGFTSVHVGIQPVASAESPPVPHTDSRRSMVCLPERSQHPTKRRLWASPDSELRYCLRAEPPQTTPVFKRPRRRIIHAIPERPASALSCNLLDGLADRPPATAVISATSVTRIRRGESPQPLRITSFAPCRFTASAPVS